MPDTTNDDTPPAAVPPVASPPATSAPAAMPEAVATGARVAIPEGWQPLPPAARRVATIVGALATLPFVAGLTVLLSVLLRPGIGGRLLIVGGLAVLAGAAGIAIARARWRRTLWRLDGRGLQVQRGVVWRSEILVPRSRVQHIDIERGPIERRFGLATLVVHTAGTRLNALRQSGFVDADAVALRDGLLPEAASGDDEL